VNTVLIIFLGVCAIILCGGLVNWVNLYMEKHAFGKKQAEALQYRLDEMDRRLSDVQEVVLAIDEKLEHLEIRQAKEQEG
jgi:hypothetical protein